MGDKSSFHARTFRTMSLFLQKSTNVDFDHAESSGLLPAAVIFGPAVSCTES
jgi:hypothetical protein